MLRMRSLWQRSQGLLDFPFKKGQVESEAAVVE